MLWCPFPQAFFGCSIVFVVRLCVNTTVDSTFRSAAQFPRLAALATNSHEELIMFVHAEFLIPTPPTDDTLFFPRSKVKKRLHQWLLIHWTPPARCLPRGPGSMKAASKVPRRSKRAQFHRNGGRRRADDDRLGAATTGGGGGGGRNSTDNKQVSG